MRDAPPETFQTVKKISLEVRISLTLYILFEFKSYRDFHTDLFPDTIGQKEGLNVDQWLSGDNREVIILNVDIIM